jgi:hypothetical protein
MALYSSSMSPHGRRTSQTPFILQDEGEDARVEMAEWIFWLYTVTICSADGGLKKESVLFVTTKLP